MLKNIESNKLMEYNGIKVDLVRIYFNIKGGSFMFKKCIVIFITTLLIVGTFGCNKQTSIEKDNWKIGLITSPLIANEDGYRSAEQMVKRYGKDRIIHKVFPVKFNLEQEAIIDKITLMALDPNVKGIIIAQGIPGVTGAIDKIREKRNDLLIIVCSPGEDPDVIASKADIVLSRDTIGTASEILEFANEKEAKTFVHYSFPRHMSYELLSQKRDILKRGCEKLGIKFIDAMIPDPGGESSISGIEKFIIEDVPKNIEKYGKQTIFYTTNYSVDKLLSTLVRKNEGIYPWCCLSPEHGFPQALGIEIPKDKEGDIEYIIKETRGKISEKDMGGRMSVWAVSSESAFVEVSVDYIKDYIDGKTNGKLDKEKIKKKLTEYLGGEVKLKELEYGGEKYENYILIISDFIRGESHI